MRVFLNVQDEVEAILAMDKIKQEAEDLLGDEDGDRVEVTQLVPYNSDVSPEELLVILKRARNALIRTRIKDCYDLAGELDRQIHYLHIQMDPAYAPQYDYGRMPDIATRILTNHEEPTE